MDTLRAGAPVPTDNAEVRTRLALAERERDSLRQANSEAAVMAHIRSAVGDYFIDSELAANLLRQSVKMVDGSPTVVSADGTPALNASFEAMSLKEAAQQLAASKPFLAGGTVKGGAGSLPSSQPAFQSESVAIHKLWGPDGDVEARNKIAINSPNLYRELRGRAAKDPAGFGLLMNSQSSFGKLTPADIARSARADAAQLHSDITSWKQVFGSRSNAALAQLLRIEHPRKYRSLQRDWQLAMGILKAPVATPTDETDCQ